MHTLPYLVAVSHESARVNDVHRNLSLKSSTFRARQQGMLVIALRWGTQILAGRREIDDLGLPR